MGSGKTETLQIFFIRTTKEEAAFGCTFNHIFVYKFYLICDPSDYKIISLCIILLWCSLPNVALI